MPPAPIGTPNPLDGLSDDDLFNLSLMAALACGKAKQTLTQSRKKHFCNLYQILHPYQTARVVEYPVAPFSCGQLKPSSLKA